MPENTTETRFAVARDGELISPLYDTLELGHQQHASIEQTMGSVGLDPDVDLVTVEVKTTYGKPKVYVPPKDIAPAEEPATEGEQTPEQP